MSGIEVSPFFSPFIFEALTNDVVVDVIISHLGPNVHDLINYRLVCHKWNDLIVRKINKSGPSLHIPLRYGPEIPQIIVKSNARRWAQEMLENVSITLTGTASRLLFDTVVVDSDFYLAGVVLKWKQFLEAHGESIRHLKFKIRSHESPKPFENHVKDCEEILTMKDLVTTLSTTPNLESLYFSIRFSNYLSGSATPQNPIVLGNLPVLHKLINITIREPKGVSYPGTLITKIFGMAPNLASLCIKQSSVLSTHDAAINSINQDIIRSLTTLEISNVQINDDPRYMINFPYLHLTTLVLNNFCVGVGRYNWIYNLLLAQQSSLIKLVLGDRKNSQPLLKVQDIPHRLDGLMCFVQFPPVMEHLKVLEVNLSKFQPIWNASYKIQFPVLESYTLSGARDENAWTFDHIRGGVLPRLVTCRSLTLNQFSLIGPIQKSDKIQIMMVVQASFPTAKCDFHSESDNQNAQEVQRHLRLGGLGLFST